MRSPSIQDPIQRITDHLFEDALSSNLLSLEKTRMENVRILDALLRATFRESFVRIIKEWMGETIEIEEVIEARHGD